MAATGGSVVACAKCGYANPPGTVSCKKCDSPLPSDSSSMEKTILVDGGDTPALGPGARLAGGRYEILAALGHGGMGSVYKAHDHELDRVIALKVIRPDLVSAPSALKRFKQEVLLASKVTHRNAVRIFDIGESGSVK